MTPPHREYWRVWSDGAGRFLIACSGPDREAEDAWLTREEAVAEAATANSQNRMLRQCPTDWRPVHCREVVIDG